MSTDEFSGIEFAVGSVTGIRQWRVDPLGRLVAVSNRHVWRPGENVAECNRRRTKAAIEARPTKEGYLAGGVMPLASQFWLFDGPTEPHPCKGFEPDCGCGFWAYHAADSGSALWSTSGYVEGVVEAYGKVTIGTRGFRAEKARIVALVMRRRQRFFDRWTISALALMAIVAAWMPSNIAGRHWLLLGMNGLSAIGFAGVMVSHALLVRDSGRNVRPDADLVLANYPDVKVYPTREAMLRAHPLSDLAITPDTDPGFWDRPAAV